MAPGPSQVMFSFSHCTPFSGLQPLHPSWNLSGDVFLSLCLQCLSGWPILAIFLHHVYYSLYKCHALLKCHSVKPLSIPLRHKEWLPSLVLLLLHIYFVCVTAKIPTVEVTSLPWFPKTDGFPGRCTFSVKTRKVLGRLGQDRCPACCCIATLTSRVTQYHVRSWRQWVRVWNPVRAEALWSSVQVALVV